MSSVTEVCMHLLRHAAGTTHQTPLRSAIFREPPLASFTRALCSYAQVWLLTWGARAGRKSLQAHTDWLVTLDDHRTEITWHASCWHCLCFSVPDWQRGMAAFLQHVLCSLLVSPFRKKEDSGIGCDVFSPGTELLLS